PSAHDRSVLFPRPCDPRDLLAFPTRRSSDLRRSCARATSTRSPPSSRRSSARTPEGPRVSDNLSTLRVALPRLGEGVVVTLQLTDRKSTRLNSSHVKISYAVFCLEKKIQGKR